MQFLDEMVWAANLDNDTVDGLAGYLNPVPAEVRHNLFLAMKEALNNVLQQLAH